MVPEGDSYYHNYRTLTTKALLSMRSLSSIILVSHRDGEHRLRVIDRILEERLKVLRLRWI